MIPDSSHQDTEKHDAPLGWWVISGEDLLAALRRVAAGEDPDLVYLEEYANSDCEQIEPKEDGLTPEQEREAAKLIENAVYDEAIDPIGALRQAGFLILRRTTNRNEGEPDA